MSFRVKCRVTLLCAAALIAATTIGNAQVSNLQADGDGNFNIMAPEPGTGPHHVVRNRYGRTSLPRSQSLTATQQAVQDTPEQIDTYKRNRRAFASRGSSGLVLPTPLPGPTHYAPVGTPPPTQHSVQEQGPTILPGSGRVIPNLPHGPETFQDRASRCAFQSSINNIHAGQFGSYMASCM
jgi:hypothetical protein